MDADEADGTEVDSALAFITGEKYVSDSCSHH